MNNTELRQYMIDKGLSQRELAKILNVEDSQVSRWINGKTKIGRAWQSLLENILTQT